MYELKPQIVYDNLNDYFIHVKKEDAAAVFRSFSLRI